MSFDPHDPRILVAGARGGGIWRSPNRGGSWEEIPTRPRASGQVQDLVADPRAVPGTFYAAVADIEAFPAAP